MFRTSQLCVKRCRYRGFDARDRTALVRRPGGRPLRWLYRRPTDRHMTRRTGRRWFYTSSSSILSVARCLRMPSTVPLCRTAGRLHTDTHSIECCITEWMFRRLSRQLNYCDYCHLHLGRYVILLSSLPELAGPGSDDAISVCLVPQISIHRS